MEGNQGIEGPGAPAIGIAGALGVALGMKDYPGGDINGFKRKLDQVIKYLASSRPTAVNLFWALERMRNAIRNPC